MTGVRVSQDGGSGGGGAGYTSSEDSSGSQPQLKDQSAGNGNGGRRPSAILRAWKNRRASNSQASQASPTSGGRRKSSALTRVLPVPLTRGGGGGVGRVDEYSLSSTRTSSTDDTRRRSLSIICRGDRESDDEFDSHTIPRHSNALHTTQKVGEGGEGGVTAAMAIRDTWLYGTHQWQKDGRRGSVSTVATSPSFSRHLPRKSFSGVMSAVGLDVEEQQIRIKSIRGKHGGGDGESVVSLSLTEEIALYTDDVGRPSANSSSSTGQSSRYTPPRGMGWTTGQERVGGMGGGGGGMVWKMPNWNNPSKLPELSPAPAIMIADPFASIRPLSQDLVGGLGMQRVESGSLDPVIPPVPASSPNLEHDGAEGVGGMQWNTTSPFHPNLHHRPSVVQEERSPTATNFPPSPSSPITEQVRRRATTYYDASSLLPVVDELPTSPSGPDFFIPHSPRSPRSPKSPRSFGHSEPSYALRKRESYSLPRPPAGYHSPKDTGGEGEGEEEIPTPRLVSMDFSSSPMSSNFAPETPTNIPTTFPALHNTEFDGGDETIQAQLTEGEKAQREEGEDLHTQFCSVLLLDLGNGTTIPLSPSPGVERADPFSLLAH